MALDDSLAKGINKRIRRELTHRLEHVPSVKRGTKRKSWIKSIREDIEKHWSDLIISLTEEGDSKDRKLIIIFIDIFDPKDQYIAYTLRMARASARNFDFSSRPFPIAITYHAFQRLIQSVNKTNLESLVDTLRAPLRGCMRNYVGDGNNAEVGSRFWVATDFGLFMFTKSDYVHEALPNPSWLLVTVIKRDSLEGKKLEIYNDCLARYEDSYM